ncbi:MAG: hypothetical protein KKB03_01940 [Nanoarchaeota archaeon]|nr:hypothetical protein [Nanoarchaeota archaeon]
MKKSIPALISSLLTLIPAVSAQNSNPSGWATGPFGGFYNVMTISFMIIAIVLFIGISIVYNSTKKKGFWIFKR